MFVSIPHRCPGANVSLKDPSKGYTALEWSQFTGRKAVSEAITNHLKANSTKNSKRLSQAMNETENWFKSKLAQTSTTTINNNGPNTSSTTNGGATNGVGGGILDNCILAHATGSAALCGVGSLSILQHVLPDESGFGNGFGHRGSIVGGAAVDTQRRPSKPTFVVPSIEITQV